MKKKYTREIHIKRLRGMMKRKKPCNCCPAAPYYGTRAGNPHWSDLWRRTPERWGDNNICRICSGFVGIAGRGCPCHIYGEEEALKRTIIALEKEETS